MYVFMHMCTPDKTITAMLPTKTSSNNGSRVRHIFGVKVSLSLNQRVQDFTGLPFLRGTET